MAGNPSRRRSRTGVVLVLAVAFVAGLGGLFLPPLSAVAAGAAGIALLLLLLAPEKGLPLQVTESVPTEQTPPPSPIALPGVERPPVPERPPTPPVAESVPVPEPPPVALSGASLDNAAWLSLVEECVDLCEELDRLHPMFDAPRREVAEHVASKVSEMLVRSGVTLIEGDTTFDRMRHQTSPPQGPGRPGDAIESTRSVGFAVQNRVLRRARVILRTTAS